MKGARVLLAASTLVACGTGQRSTMPTAAPIAVTISDAGLSGEAAADAEVGDASRPPEVEAWLREAVDRCRRSTSKAELTCVPGPHSVTKEDIQECAHRCFMESALPA